MKPGITKHNACNESAGKAEVIGTLQPGDEVIVNANDEIKEGQLIND